VRTLEDRLVYSVINHARQLAQTQQRHGRRWRYIYSETRICLRQLLLKNVMFISLSVIALLRYLWIRLCVNVLLLFFKKTSVVVNPAVIVV